jgi:hypothetical protein
MEDASSREGYIQHATTGMDGARKMISQEKKRITGEETHKWHSVP